MVRALHDRLGARIRRDRIWARRMVLIAGLAAVGAVVHGGEAPIADAVLVFGLIWVWMVLATGALAVHQARREQEPVDGTFRPWVRRIDRLAFALWPVFLVPGTLLAFSLIAGAVQSGGLRLGILAIASTAMVGSVAFAARAWWSLVKAGRQHPPSAPSRTG